MVPDLVCLQSDCTAAAADRNFSAPVEPNIKLMHDFSTTSPQYRASSRTVVRAQKRAVTLLTQ